MMLFEKEYTVTSHDTDSKNVIKPSELLRYLQDTANSQMKAEKPSYDELHANGKAFIIAKISVDIFDELHKYDKLTVRSWPCHSRGVTSTRCYDVHRDGVLVAQATSIWALIDRNNNNSLIQMPDFEPTSNYEYGEPVHCNFERFVIPKNEMKHAGNYNVTYSKIDLNGHMNNTNYPNMFFDCIPDIVHKTVVAFTINYKKEIKLGDNVEIRISEPHTNDDSTIGYYFQAINNGEISTQAYFALKQGL